MAKTKTNLKKVPLQMRFNPSATGVGSSKGSQNHSKQTAPKKPSLESRARNANSFFDGLFARFDNELHLVTIEEKDPELRMRMRRSAKRLKDMIAFAQRFHGHRFSDDPKRIAKAAEEARQLVDLHDKLHRRERDWESIMMVKRFDQLTTSHPQPEVFGRKFSSWASATLGVMLLHYVPLVDAFEASVKPASSLPKVAKSSKQSATEDFDTAPLWTVKAFKSLCERLDLMESLSFKTYPSFQTPLDNPTGDSGRKATKKKRRGRPRIDNDDPENARILKEWATGHYLSYKDCARKLGIEKLGNLVPWRRVQRIVVRQNKVRSREKLASKRA